MAQARQPRPPARRRKREPVRVILLGFGCLGLSLLQGLLDAEGDCEVVGVFRWSSRKKSRREVDEYERAFARLVKEEGLREIVCEGVNSFRFAKIMEELKPGCLLIGSWGEIVKPPLLEREDLAIINCHPAKLPSHRGPNPYASAVRAGVSESGVTFHLVTEDVDAGPILLQESVLINEDDTGGSLRAKCGLAARQLVPELMTMLASGKKLRPLKQEETLQSYFPAIKLEDGMIRWNWDPADIRNQVRGLQPWLESYTFASTPLGAETMLAFKSIRLVHQPHRHPSGMILSVRRGVVRAASSDRDIQIEISQYRFYFLAGFLPGWLSRILGGILLRPGMTFRELNLRPS